MQRNDLSRSLIAFDQDSTLVAVVELSLSTWLVAGLVPGLTRQPLKKQGADPAALLALLHRWRDEAVEAGGEIGRMVVAFEAGRDGFWLARWLRSRGIEAHVIHPTSIPVSREHRRAKTDRLDAGLLMRAALGWLRGEPKHCSMVAIPTLAEEDARRPNREHEHLVGERTRIICRMKATMTRHGIRNFNVKLRKASERLEGLRSPEGVPLPPNTLAELRRDMARLRFIADQIKEIERVRLERLQQAPQDGAHPMLVMLARIRSIGIETADMLVHEAFARPTGSKGGGTLRRPDRRAGREREQTTRQGAGQGRQCARAPRHAATGVALAHVPEGQRLGAVVSGADRRRQAGYPQNHDRGSGPQALDRALALRDDRRAAGRRRPASGDMSDRVETAEEQTQVRR